MRVVLVGCVALAGCGGAAVDAQIRDLRERLAASEQARRELTTKVDDLEGRVYLLTDRMERQSPKAPAERGEGAGAGGSRLPVVTLAPPAPSSPDPNAPSSDGGSDGDAGSAAAASRPPPSRPLLRVEGRPGSLSVTAPPSARPPAPAPRKPAVGGAHAAALPPAATTHGGAATTRPAPAAAHAGSPPANSRSGLPPSAAPTRTPASPPSLRAPSRVIASSAGGPAGAPGSPVARPPVGSASNDDLDVGAADPLSLFQKAQEELAAGRSDDAAADFRAFVRRYPRHHSAEEAQYRLGESYFVRKEFAAAAPEYRQVLKRWSTGGRAADALYKLGLCLLALDQVADGRAALAEAAHDYPQSEAGRLATRRLAELSTQERKR